MQGDINRALLGAKVDFAHAIFDLITGPVHEGIELVCNVIPDVEIAPLGAGIQIEPKSICEELADFIAPRRLRLGRFDVEGAKKLFRTWFG